MDNNNTALQKQVMDELAWDPSIIDTHIGVAANNGIITLTGYVSSYPEKNNAVRAAKRVKGVTAVVDELDVTLPGTALRNDLDIAESALASLRFHSAVPHERLQLTVKDGYITLEGNVDWQYQRTAAENSVKFQIGVKGVNNLIAVKSSSVSASNIKSKIQSALVRNAQIDANHITVETHDGEAILGGSVRSLAEKEQAEKAAWSAPGINRVENNVRVTI